METSPQIVLTSNSNTDMWKSQKPPTMDRTTKTQVCLRLDTNLQKDQRLHYPGTHTNPPTHKKVQGFHNLGHRPHSSTDLILCNISANYLDTSDIRYIPPKSSETSNPDTSLSKPQRAQNLEMVSPVSLDTSHTRHKYSESSEAPHTRSQVPWKLHTLKHRPPKNS